MRRVITTLMVLVLALFVSASLMATGGAEAVGGEVKLNFPTFWVGQDSKAGPVEDVVEAFNAQYDGKYEVVIEPNPDTDGYRDKINTQMATGRAPDVFVFNPDPTTFQYYDSDLLMDFTAELAGPWGDDFVRSYIDESTINGRTKTVPYEIGITPIWYNSDLFAKAGIREFPKTLDDFAVAAEKLKAAGIVPTSQMTGGSNAWTSMLWYSHIMGSLGGPDVWDRPLTDPVYVQAAEVLQAMYQNGNTTRDAVGGDAGVAGGHYMAGNTAMFINGPWYVGRIRGDAPAVHAATKLAPAPQVGDYYGHQIGFLLSNLAAGNTSDAGRREAVLAFMKFMTDPDNVKMVSEAAGSLFAIKYELGPSADPLQREFVRAASEATFAIGHFQSQYPVDVVQEFGQALAEMALGQATPRQFVQMLIDVNK